MKAIVLVDLPDDYEEYGSGNWYVFGYDLKIVYEENRALMTYKYIDDDMAQLKPMPNKMPITQQDYGIGSYFLGYNACIDEILGEEE